MDARAIKTRALIMIPALFLSVAACTPSPRYRSHSKTSTPGTKKPSGKPASRPQASLSLISPVRGFDGSRVTSLYGVRKDPRYGTQAFHTGIDIDAEAGDDVMAAADGEIIFSGNQQGYGKVVIVEHEGEVCTVYAHLSSSLCENGEIVKAGQVIGRVGVTGKATGSHLHFEVRIGGKTVDPLRYLR